MSDRFVVIAILMLIVLVGTLCEIMEKSE